VLRGPGGIRFIRNLQNGPIQEVSTALYRTEEAVIGLSLATKAESSPSSQQHSHRRTPVNASNGCLELLDIYGEWPETCAPQSAVAPRGGKQKHAFD
jgi:hypothetical protein